MENTKLQFNFETLDESIKAQINNHFEEYFEVSSVDPEAYRELVYLAWLHANDKIVYNEDGFAYDLTDDYPDFIGDKILDCFNHNSLNSVLDFFEIDKLSEVLKVK
jgi:hypothetical protein